MNNNSELILDSPNLEKILEDGPPLLSANIILGVGTFGVVCKAIHDGKPVALKIVKNGDDAKGKTVKNEAEILGWRHRNIVQTLKIIESSKFGFVIMERVSGESLQLVLDSIALPLMHRVFITMDILSALSYCHLYGLLHRDVKPQNVLVAWARSRPNFKSTSESYICKLCDFGVSIKIDCQELAPTKPIRVKGTARYMSPEALCGELLSPATDIYSLGVTMWHLKHRQSPYAWIKRNDVVIYQVVKNNLRPDAENFPIADHEQSSTTPFKNVHNRKRKDNKENDPPACEVPAKVMKPNTVAGRLAIQDVNVNTNGANVPTMQNKRTETVANVTSDLPDWAERFQSTGHKGSVKAEAVYAEIFKSCWVTDPRSRPLGKHLRQRLEQLC